MGRRTFDGLTPQQAVALDEFLAGVGVEQPRRDDIVQSALRKTNWDVESFLVLLLRLCQVYDIALDVEGIGTLAIVPFTPERAGAMLTAVDRRRAYAAGKATP